MRRLAFVTLSLAVIAGVLLVLVLSQGQESLLPSEAQALLERYATTGARAPTLETAVRAEHPENFDTRMAAPIPSLARFPTRSSPGLYSGQVIHPVGVSLTYPPDDVWCLSLQSPDRGQFILLATRHEQLYGERWTLHDLPSGVSARHLDTVGCSTPTSD